LKRRHLALLLLAMIAAALSGLSLIVSPPTQQPVDTTYLPAR
jgi:hypothetical protein